MDGVTAAGKTTLARELAAAVGDRGRTVIHLGMDGFHHPRAHRYRQGRGSALGYYQDAYDFEGFARLVLIPLGPNGNLRYRSRIIDLASDEALDEPTLDAPVDSVLLVDGSFLQRDLSALWDEVVFVDTSIAAARERGTRRDTAQFGGLQEAREAFDNRYHAASRFYLDEVRPAARASVVIENDDLDRPVLRRL